MARSVYKKEDGELTFKEIPGKEREMVVFAVGLVPYHWVVHVDPEGDEFDYRPIFYVHFKGNVYWSWWRRMIPFGYPYSKLLYYRETEQYDGDRHSTDMKYIQVRKKISRS